MKIPFTLTAINSEKHLLRTQKTSRLRNVFSSHRFVSEEEKENYLRIFVKE